MTIIHYKKCKKRTHRVECSRSVKLTDLISNSPIKLKALLLIGAVTLA